MTLIASLRRRPLGVATILLALATSTGGAIGAIQSDAPTAAAPAPAEHGVLVRAIAPSLYELAYSPRSDTVFVASARASAEGSEGGAVYALDPRTLAVRTRIDLPLRPFALALDPSSDTLYVGHTVDGAVSAIDAASATLKGTLRHGCVDADGKPIHVREIAVDARQGKVFVGGVSDGGFLWVIDAVRFATQDIVQDADLPTIGLTVDEDRHRLYLSGTAAYAALDTRNLEVVTTQFIPERLHPDDAKRRFLVNTAVDAQGKRLFANQLNNGEGTLVFDTASGALLHTLPSGDAPLGIRFNPVRNEVYVAGRGSGTLQVFDADRYTLKRRIALPAHPNTVAVSADGQTLWVSVKQASAGRGAPAAAEQVARIDLATH